GLTTVTFRQLTITPHHRDRIVGLEERPVGTKFWPLLTGEVRFGQVRGHDVGVQRVNRDSISNYDCLVRETSTLEATPTTTDGQTCEPAINLAQAANQMLNSILYKIPEDMDLRDLTVVYRDDSTNQRVDIPQVDINNGYLSASIFLNGRQAAWQLSGKMSP